MKMKKIIILLTTLLLIVFAAGCGSDPATTDTSEPEATGIEDTGTEAAEGSDTIVVGCMDSYSPYAYLDEDGKPAGYDVAVMTEAAKRAGYQIEFVATSWDALFPGLDSGKWDAVANQIYRTDERNELYNMGTVPYIQSAMKLVVAADNDDVVNLSDLNGGKIAAIVGDYATGVLEEYLEENPGAFEIVYYEATMAMLLEEIINERVVATVNDPFTVITTAEANNVSDKIKLVGDNLFTNYVYAAYQKTDRGVKIRADFDAAMQSMIDDGTLSEISKTYFNYDYNSNLGEGIIK